MPSVAQAPLAGSSLQPPDHDSDVVNDVDDDDIVADADADADSVAEC